ncbi:unnamed protein product [Clonostachys chloroleuca]|uniref:Cuticle-degrading protease n=1 Tax=Clonostachys chloroleuca TaxID=1926264 RepID=A0AA35Q825_9HYPO|nr:unnamed protein product [Clonostachys chloroleuca]
MRSAALLSLLPLALAAPATRAPLYTREEAIEGKYIVKVKNGASASINSAIASIASNADHVYKNLGGFSASLTSEEVETLRNNPDIEYIEQDQKATMFAIQTGAPWGLARLSNKEPGSSTYTYDDAAGEGTCVYVLDTGIDTELSEFGGRASWAGDFIGTGKDDQGHGTHCAGTVGSSTYGVAKKAKLFAIKVLDFEGNGEYAQVIAGLDMIADHAATQDCPKGVVASMSLGGPKSQAVNDAAANVVSAGIFLAVAAGNGNRITRLPEDVALVSPASEPSACTVGASDSQDRVASFSNFGALLDVYAPGVGIRSLQPGGSTLDANGTSMATPHVAGLAAYYLSLGATEAAGACSYIVGQGLKGVISGVPSGTANVLVQNGQA